MMRRVIEFKLLIFLRLRCRTLVLHETHGSDRSHGSLFLLFLYNNHEKYKIATYTKFSCASLAHDQHKHNNFYISS